MAALRGTRDAATRAHLLHPPQVDSAATPGTLLSVLADAATVAASDNWVGSILAPCQTDRQKHGLIHTDILHINISLSGFPAVSFNTILQFCHDLQKVYKRVGYFFTNTL